MEYIFFILFYTHVQAGGPSGILMALTSEEKAVHANFMNGGFQKREFHFKSSGNYFKIFLMKSNLSS